MNRNKRLPPLHPHVKALREGLLRLEDKWNDIIYYEEWYWKNYEKNSEGYDNVDMGLFFDDYCFFIWSTIPRVVEMKYNLLPENIKYNIELDYDSEEI